MNYFDQLKTDYTSPEIAHKAYTLQKTIWKVGVVLDNAPAEIKEAFEIQQKINAWCEDILFNNNASLIKHLTGNEDNTAIISFFKNNEETLELLGIDRSLYINLVTNSYTNSLNNAVSNSSWEKLEELVNAEKYNEEIIPESEVQAKLDKTSQTYALSSIFIGKASSTQRLTDKIEESLRQLTLVVGCSPEQIGSNQFNIFFDTEECTYAGYSSQCHEKNQKLYLNAELSYDAFAHEWLHSMDNIWARERGLSDTHASESDTPVINDLLNASKKASPEVIKKLKEDISSRVLSHCNFLIERGEITGGVEKPEKLYEYVKEQITEVLNGTFNKDKFQKTVEEHKNDNCYGAIVAYLSTEMELLQNISKSKNFNESIFYRYAIDMDKNLNDLDILSGEYSTTNLEMFARLYETYVDMKLTAMGEKNIISTHHGNGYRPLSEELNGYIEKWEPIMTEVRSLLDKVYPVEKKYLSTQSSFPPKLDKLKKSGVLSNIQNIRQSALNENELLQVAKKGL